MKGSNTMAKNTDTTQEQREQEFRNRINGMAQERTAKIQEQFEAAFAKAAEEAKRSKKRKLAREVTRCFFVAAGIVALYLAENAGLISAVLTSPVYAIAFGSIGWHLCKINRLRGRK